MQGRRRRRRQSLETQHERHSLDHRPPQRAGYGWRSVKKTCYRRVDGGWLTPRPTSKRAIGQGFGVMEPAGLLRAIETCERARHPQDAMMASCGKKAWVRCIAQEFLAL
jgi:hypothetical protein